MIDSKTKKRIVVRMDARYGPYIRVATYADADALQDKFDEDYYVLYWMMRADELEDDGGREYYFGGGADPVKLQTILDEIEF
ncbi:hypothetical protein [Massilia soli]|uniref:Uncharacterized protein n=1 Tax=Massilia soli TaxID=2792854 RepID=A0ABS7SLX5_9BURK|nr:hypothetical protein [Massilia soli]MBZ2207178.1 hypothetical protein [Massilia soli]